MRILFLNQFYTPDTAATGQLLADLASSLVKRGHEVHVLCSRNRYNGSELTQTGKEIIDGVYVHRVRATGFGRRKLVGRAMDYLTFYVSAAWHAIIMQRPDVCVSLTTPPFISIIGLILCRLKGTRIVIWVMDVYPEIATVYGVMRKQCLLFRFMARLNKILYCNAEAIISLGECMTRRLESAGAPSNHIYTVHNWVPGENNSSPFKPQKLATQGYHKGKQ